MNDTIVSSSGGFTVIPEADAKKRGIHNPPEALPQKAQISKLTPEIAQSHPQLVPDEDKGMAVCSDFLRPNNDG